MYGVLIFLLIVTCCVLVASVLLQAGQGGGLASLGGGAGTEVLMGGRQAVTILTHLTRWSAGIFLFLAMVLQIMSARGGRPTSVLEGNIPAPQPVQTAPLPLQTTPAPGQQATPTTPAPQTPNR
jgi:preprotein translocase subunit SecG